MSKAILVANRDLVTLQAIRETLSREHDVVYTQLGRDALGIAVEHELSLAIIDTELSDMTGLDLLRELRPSEHSLPCLFITRLGHDASTDEAISLGVTCCIAQPLTMGMLLIAVRRTIADGPGANRAAPRRHSFIRWADLVVPVAEFSSDVRTLEEWGRARAVSVGALRNWCRTANLPARRSLLLARMLRAVIRHMTCPVSPAQLLNVVDRRTLAKMLLAAGGTSADLPPSVHEFLERQRFITDAEALDALRTALTLSGYLPNHSGDGASMKSINQSTTSVGVRIVFAPTVNRLEKQEEGSTRDGNSTPSAENAKSGGSTL